MLAKASSFSSRQVIFCPVILICLLKANGSLQISHSNISSHHNLHILGMFLLKPIYIFHKTMTMHMVDIDGHVPLDPSCFHMIADSYW